MSRRFKVGKRSRLLAMDYDGTLATNGSMAPCVARALEAAKTAGLLLLLVTGRRLEDLLEVCPEITQFDMVVVENGAVLYWPLEVKVEVLASIPPRWMIPALARRGVTATAGRIVLGIHRDDAGEMQDFIDAHALELQVTFNKDAAMILPKGVNKGTGVREVCKRLATEVEEIVAIGDAENDLALFHAATLKIATDNAVTMLKDCADQVLKQPNGSGVVTFIDEYLSGIGHST